MSRGRLERQHRQRPEGDREERRVAVEVGLVGARRLVVERLAGVEPGAGVVVGVDVGERIGRQVEDDGLDSEQQPDGPPRTRTRRTFGVSKAASPPVMAIAPSYPSPAPAPMAPLDRATGIANSYRSEGPGPGATLHQPC